MENLNFTLDQLKNTSEDWNQRTKNLLISIGGGGNMWGGSSRLVFATLHGHNSITKTGTIEIKGIVTKSYNIDRGANGPTNVTVKYYRDITDFDKINSEMQPAYSIEIAGSCGGAEEALASILSAEREWLK